MANGKLKYSEIPSSITAENPIDVKALQALRDMAGVAAEEVITEVIKSYFEEGEQLLQKMSAAAAQKEPIALLHAAHTMKSASATLGAIKLSNLCKEIELMCRNGITADTLELVSLLEANYVAVKAALQLECPGC